jgi:hypothetical protein
MQFIVSLVKNGFVQRLQYPYIDATGVIVNVDIGIGVTARIGAIE